MELTRRKILALGSSTFALASLTSLPVFASTTDDEIAALTGGAELGEGAITLTAPEIAENGNTVPIAFDAPGAVEVTLFADGNPVPNVATFKFGPLSASRSASTRIRLATTQDVVAIAKMEDGSFQTAKANVKVTIGGCGG
ncbi:thiosulfate oxidation carrier protein SoxY [Roseibium porphyridii]|uniref:Thiosulfate oxidation carrier protein SoxY n=1 Tax=Roseibium porphyridii TaxID=2866279 RepID=A0ABY8FD31_9HYPH|nr:MULTISPECIES: thiosulfate oxidation carrier protein SoxY [Stappiaceae]QFT31143.1 sulfur oxidation protein SoxY [Labrenzia sp. THAF82]WFE91755.1 thiosulfate oxidation carrier protein SoxY [Roseibium sp. KMA01]